MLETIVPKYDNEAGSLLHPVHLDSREIKKLNMNFTFLKVIKEWLGNYF